MENKEVDVLAKINSIYASLSNTQRKVADFLLANLNRIAFQTLDSLALEIGVSTTSIIRVAKILGFSSYSEFQQNIQNNLTKKVGLPERLSRSHKNKAGSGLLKSTFETDMNNIMETLSMLSEEDLKKCVSMISKAKNVYILGLRGSFSISHYLMSRLSQIRKNVHLVQAIGSLYPEEIISAEKDDVCIAFLFPRYPRTTISLLSSMKEKGVKNILITSPSFKQIEIYADIILKCQINSVTFKDSFVAPMSLINYIVEEVIQSDRDKAMEIVSEIERVLSDGFYLGV
ncbi:MurR/RpiR family transcriptional regulator [Anaeropeptidivorans aminofermentans]|jgi:DNA-binding MurR/RpiR family transcriptional regulator|uniref:MurR/RpiR family transcriptional regulator n=1 Tax=Anaeropeptidivorans aminofermentans TaxID=2934315 RepID=UPI0020240B4F|nr:MurR/RpiR family transcriptional regulator [Anaeropeptidivorans aminofermentans]MBE6011019.1 MurR/RpiR family transcriptional regulator [Lachnospiraceae bacterium]